MSRRRGEFEHRTSIFEGAFRAWSHLGGLDPEDVETKPASELDPLTHPILNDPRLSGSKSSASNLDGTPRREYPYEPLPRSGLQHPYVQAILSPWLGPDADAEAIQLGLTTLRTWWQHRRKGESGSAIAALGTEKMKGVVEGYTRHFFTLAHCVVVNDKAHPPRGLHQKMKELEKAKRKRTKEESKTQDPIIALTAGEIRADLTDPNLTPLEKLHAAQRRQLECANGGGMDLSYGMNSGTGNPNFRVDMTGKCLPGSIDLPSVVDVVSRQATQLAHHGMGSGIVPVETLSASNPSSTQAHQYGDPNTTPVVFVSSNGDIQIAMTVDGITCAHCVKIVETVLRGCNGNKSPISGLLDAAADRDLSSVLIKIDKASNAKRIAFEAARNLAMVGYTAIPKEMSIVGAGADSKAIADLGQLSTAFEVVANTELQDVFDWSSSCTCPDNGVLRGECARHSQMNKRIFEAFNARQQQVVDFMAGCGMKYGMDCTCGPECRCKNCPIHKDGKKSNDGGEQTEGQQERPTIPAPIELRNSGANSSVSSVVSSLNQPEFGHPDHPIQIEQPMDFSNFGMGPPAVANPAVPPIHPLPIGNNGLAGPAHNLQAAPQDGGWQQERRQSPSRLSTRMSVRNPSVLSYGNSGGLRNSIRGMSITSETTFGRAMSGLSALSIDWENLDDFDLEVDHSAHIQGNIPGNVNHNASNPVDERRSSLRRSIMSTGSQDPHVSFKI